MIFYFSELAESMIPMAGGKGAVLAQLFQADFQVPDGLIILPTAFDAQGLTAAAERLLQEKINHLRGNAPQQKFAVRSSALSEDSAQASFAGEFETVLNVRDDQEIMTAVATVFASRNSERVQAYAAAKALVHNNEMAVVIQKMVPAEIAGVLFTADPVQNDHRYMSGNFVRGLGEQLVSGEATPETFTIEKLRGRYAGSKQLATGMQKQLFLLGEQLEERFGVAQDIEWAAVGKQLFLLQSRPVTTMTPGNPQTDDWNYTRIGTHLWTSTNVGEAFPDVMTPAAWSITKRALEKALPATFPDNVPVIGNIGGRLYINLTPFIQITKTLSFLGPVMQRQSEAMMGIVPPVIYDTIRPYPFFTLLPSLVKLIKLQIKAARSKGAIDAFLIDFHTLYKAKIEALAQIETADKMIELIQSFDALFNEAVFLLQAATLPIQSLQSPLEEKLEKLVGVEERIQLLSGFSNGVDHLASLGPLVGLAQLIKGELSQADYLFHYGHRGTSEADISQPRPLLEEPGHFDHFLAQHEEDAIIAYNAVQQQQKNHLQARERLQKQYPIRSYSLLRRIDNLAEAYKRRERIRTEIVRLGYLGRLVWLKAGELCGLGDDLFFLNEDELLAMLEGRLDAAPFIVERRAVYERNKQYPLLPPYIYGRFDPQSWADDPHRRHDFFSELLTDTADTPVENDNILRGFAGAAGVVEGVVRRIDDPAEWRTLQKGEILVTHFTNVGWTMLFPKAAAVVTDVGAPLSHAAIVARELGIPAVVGCGNATRRLKTGDHVRIDGTKGIVILLSTASESD